MTVSDLDRLITRTELTPATKVILRRVRKHVISDTLIDPKIGRTTWSVSMDTDGNVPATFTFSFKKDIND